MRTGPIVVVAVLFFTVGSVGCGDDNKKKQPNQNTNPSDNKDDDGTNPLPNNPGNNQGSACTHNGQNTTVGATFWDPDLFPFAEMLTVDNPQAITQLIDVQNFPTIAGGVARGTTDGQVSLAGPNSAWATCGFCVLGRRTANGANKFFLGTEGTGTATIPNNSGDNMAVALQNLKLVEVRETTTQGVPDYQVVPNGETWCIPNFAFGRPTLRWPCEIVSETFAEGQDICLTSADGSLAQIWTCTNGEASRKTDCKATGMTCRPTDPSPAVCVAAP